MTRARSKRKAPTINFFSHVVVSVIRDSNGVYLGLHSLRLRILARTGETAPSTGQATRVRAQRVEPAKKRGSVHDTELLTLGI
jgi:hypothetical protein